MFSLICAWINGWVNNSLAGDLRRHRAYYDVTVMLHENCNEQRPEWVPIIIRQTWQYIGKAFYWLAFVVVPTAVYFVVNYWTRIREFTLSSIKLVHLNWYLLVKKTCNISKTLHKATVVTIELDSMYQPFSGRLKFVVPWSVFLLTFYSVNRMMLRFNLLPRRDFPIVVRFRLLNTLISPKFISSHR